MAQLDDKTLQNLNKRLKEMDEILASDYRKALDLGKAFTQGFSTEQIDAFLRKLGKINRADAAKLNVMFNLVDVNGRPITVQEAKYRIEQLKGAIERGQASTKIRGTSIVGLGSMTNELKRYKDALSVLGMSTSQQFDLISRNVKKVNNEVKGLRKGFGDMLPTLQRLASAFGVAFSVRGLAQFGKKLIETRGEFEMQFVAMKQIIGDVDAATKIWNQTMQQALQSPFKAMQLVTYTKQLAAYRIETEKLFDTTKRLADISAGLGVDMGRLILAYGQVKSANFLRASEIRQFTEAGVNIVGNLSRYFTELEGRAVSTAEVMERVTKRMVSFSDVETIFKRMTDEGGEFFNMQEVQANTVKGQINKLHDAYDQMLNTIGESKQGAIREMVEALNELVRNWRNVVVYLYGTAAAMGVIVAKTKILPWLVKSFKDAGNSVVFFNRNLRKAGITLDDYIVRQRMATRGATGFSKAMHLAGIAGANLEKVLRMIPSTIWWVAAIEGITMLVERLTEARREANRLQKDLSEIKVENSKRASDEIKNYDELIHRMNELNRGSVERRNVIDKINSQYGKYIGFLVTEATTLPELAEAQERVTKNIQEAARARAEEASAQRIQENFIKKEQEIIRGNWFSRLYDQSYLQYKEGSNELDTALSLSDAAKFAEYYRSKIENLTDEQVEAYANDKEKLLEATTEWLKAFLGIDSSDVQLTSFGFEELADLYIEEEKRLRNARERITLDLGGLTKEQQEAMKSLSSSVSEAITKLSYAGKGEEINIEDLGIKFVAPTDLGEKSGIFEAIKQEINKRKDEFIIDLKLRWGYITEQQAEDAKKAGASTGDIFVDAVNKEIEKEILQSRGISNTYSELLDSILDPSKSGNWDDTTWNNVNEAIDLITRNLITSSDITNGLTNYTKILSGNLENGREAIDEAVKRQNLLVDGTEEEVERAQEAVDKAKERYKWLLKIAKLLGLDTKSADEIVEEEGYDLSVGQFRLAAAQSAFMEKFGKTSNAYGKQLSQIGVTENLKEVADAYHKQSDELDGLIKNQEKALKNETNLTEEQKENAKTTIENLKEQKSMAEFLAEFFGYVPKKTTTRTTHENASKLISLIKEMRSEYDKLSKSAYGYAKSEEKVREAYKDSVKEILGKAGITDYDFTTNEGMIKALEKVKSYATKLGKDAAAEVQKYIDQLETEIEINAQVKIREDFVKEIEKSFNDYELTLELDKLNISPEAAKNLFPEFDSQTLGELQDAMQEFYEKQGDSFDEEDLKAYKQWSDKIDAEILKSRKEKAKQYSKYLEKEYSERAKVEMQYAKDVAFVTANFNGEQQKNILKGIEDKYQKDINELTWKSFKESAFYVEMMDDLSSVPADYMKIMLDKIEELLAHPETLSPRALKEAINARQKIIEAQMDFDQIAVMKGSVSEIRAAANDVGGKTWAQTKKRLDEEQKAQAEKLKGLEEEIRCYEEIQGQLKGLEQHDEAVATANRALPEDVISMLENTDIDTLIKRYSDELDSISVSEESTTSSEKDANAQIQARIEYLQRIIPLLVDYRTALDERSAYQATDAGQSALFSRGGGETSSSVGQTITEYKKEAEQVSNRLSTLKKWQKAFTNFNNSFSKFNKNAADMVGRLGALSTAAFDLYDALGGETDAMTEAWKDFGGTIVNTITQALEMIPALVAGFVTAGTTINAAMGIIGLIAEAIQLVLVLITGLSKLHDAGYEKEIENQQKIIDNLQRAYNRLEKEIEKTWDTASYIRTYNDETQNLYEQIEALNKQIAAEEAKKNTDKDKIQGYKDSIQDAEDELDELKQKQIEVFGGIGEEGYRDAAQGFVDAWKSAFLETGDGLQGLQDHFDEFLNDWFVKQATMRVAGRMLEPLFRQIDSAVDQYGGGGTNVLMQELQNVREKFGVLAPQLSEALEELAGMWGLGGEGSLSGLAAGIQGMTEEQANILEAYWNSVRGYTANIDMNVATIVGLLSNGTNGGVGEGKGNIFSDPNVETNPMLKQLDLIAVNTAATHRILESVTKSGHSQGGYGIKVFAN